MMKQGNGPRMSKGQTYQNAVKKLNAGKTPQIGNFRRFLLGRFFFDIIYIQF